MYLFTASRPRSHYSRPADVASGSSDAYSIPSRAALAAQSADAMRSLGATCSQLYPVDRSLDLAGRRPLPFAVGLTMRATPAAARSL